MDITGFNLHLWQEKWLPVVFQDGEWFRAKLPEGISRYHSTVNLKLDFLGLGNPIHTEISIVTNHLSPHFIPIHLIQPY